MSAKNRGTAIRIAGVERRVRFTFNGIAAYEEATGDSLLDLFSFDDATIAKAQGASSEEEALEAIQAGNLGGGFKFGTVRALLYAGLVHEDESLTLLGAGELLEDVEGEAMPEKIQTVMSAISSAIAEAFTSDAPAKKKKG